MDQWHRAMSRGHGTSRVPWPENSLAGAQMPYGILNRFERGGCSHGGEPEGEPGERLGFLARIVGPP
eukprot:4446602-Prymnesium_polylepis.1